MALRLILVGAVAGLGLSLPSASRLQSWGDSTRIWAHARFAAWDAQMPADASAFVLVAEPSVPPTDSAAQIEIKRGAYSLRRYTNDTTLALRIAQAIVVEGGKKNINPALLVGVLLTEDAKLDPMAKSFVGARGLMQVMPFHAGKWKGCTSADLFAIDSNICHGVSILADLIKRSPTVASALQRYNGCVRGTNTPNCHTYSGKVLKFAEQAATQMLSFSLSD